MEQITFTNNILWKRVLKIKQKKSNCECKIYLLTHLTIFVNVNKSLFINQILGINLGNL